MKYLVISLVLTFSQAVIAQYEQCTDLICYYETENRMEEEKQQEQEQEAFEYRTQQLQLQQQYLEETQWHNTLLEEQIEQMERQEATANQQLFEQKKLNAEQPKASTTITTTTTPDQTQWPLPLSGRTAAFAQSHAQLEFRSLILPT